LREDGRGRVIVLGFSMGSLLALRLAALQPGDVAGVIAMSVPLELALWRQAAIGALSRLRANRWLGDLVGHHPKRAGPDIRMLRMAEANPSLRHFPYAALREFVALQEDVRARLSEVRAPLLLMHGRLDHAASPDGSARVAQAVSSADVQRIVLPRSFHHLAVDLDRDQVFEAILAFSRRILGPPARPKPREQSR
jgi:carboxylesterase